MCNLYSLTSSQEAIRALTRAIRDTTGNLPFLPGIYPDYKAPIVRNTPSGRELAMARWGMSTAEQNQASAAAQNKATGGMSAPDPIGPRSGADRVCGSFP